MMFNFFPLNMFTVDNYETNLFISKITLSGWVFPNKCFSLRTADKSNHELDA